MAKTLLASGPAGAGKTLLIQALASEHPDYCWHLVRLRRCRNPAQEVCCRVDLPPWAGVWRVAYRADEALTSLPDLVRRIAGSGEASRAIVAFAAGTDPVLRHAYAYDLRVFVMPPIAEERQIFRRPDQARRALEQVMHDSAAFAAEVFGLGDTDADMDEARGQVGSAATADGNLELNEAHLARFLGCPFGAEIAVRVQFQPTFSSIADADIVILNTAAGPPSAESEACWHKVQGLLARLRRSDGSMRLAYACDLSDPQDPCRERILRKMAERLCRV